MSQKDVDDIIQEGIYGKRETKPDERRRFLGTIRERVVLALTKGQLMQDKALQELESAMQEHRNTTLLLNGEVSSRFMTEEKRLAEKYSIPYTEVSNQGTSTDLGAVLTYDYAVDIEEIFVSDKEEVTHEEPSFFDKVKGWFSGK
ncbi:hypothetical protein N781_02990 [Pontibacillus halophilus JSM 076056 = DSM 19796]|uniref:DUF1694 domain-containing protein n=1 Tax=Pontibacillus halophilus JSM 076056 = DSM 19796 TaxID=1385510 RepID=A0A0A5GFL9_9BACI|nr:YueI family protein [Pontibacillus halophilus]KGX92006.1 hypothetical protein N781_02990 [Pontibacillus halophilus JSM 076056 = DSM 19796]